MSVSYGGDKITFEDGSTVGSGWAGFKNRIINGAMVVDQRNGGASTALSSGVYGADRIMYHDSAEVGRANGTFQQVSDAPTGFDYSVKLTFTSGKTSSGASTRTQLRNYIEGVNTIDLQWGTANAQTVTLSFWVKSSVTGIHCVPLINQNETRSYVATYTINQANTWEYKTITVPGDTTGTWNKDTSIGIRLSFDMGSGSTYETSSANTWLSGWYFSVAGCAKPATVTDATWQITGIQFEKGSQATSFDWRPYPVELQLCQRYYYNTMVLRGANSLTAPTNNAVELQGTRHQFGDVIGYRGQMYSHPVIMRAAPTIATYNPNNSGTSGQVQLYAQNGATQNYAVGAAGYTDGLKFIAYTGISVGTTGLSCEIWAHWSASAEIS